MLQWKHGIKLNWPYRGWERPLKGKILSDFSCIGYYMGDMQALSDAQLFRDYAQQGTETAFAELVQRHANLVYSAALRQVESPDAAADIAQAAFISLARGAKSLAPTLPAEASLAGWLCRCTRNLCLNYRRDEFRRQKRERHAMEQILATPDAAPDWERLRGVLDDSMSELDEADYDALVLRYYQNQDFRAVGAAIGVSDDTAQKRVSRALEKLRELLAQRGVRTPAAALAGVISANAVQSAPPGLAAMVSTAAVLAGATASTPTAIAAATAIAMTTLQKTLVITTVAVLAGAGIYETRQAAQLREQNQTLKQQQSSFDAEMARLRSENQRWSNRVAQATDQRQLAQEQLNELLRLRSQSGQAQSAIRELARAKPATVTQPVMPAYITNAMAQGIAIAERYKKNAVAAKVARMQEALHLTDAQAQAVSDILLKRMDETASKLLQTMSSGQMNGLPLEARNPSNEEAEIKALLSPEQLAGYDAFKQADALAEANENAKTQVERMADKLRLSPAQQDQVRSLLMQDTLSTRASSEQSAIAEAQAAGNVATALDLEMKAAQHTIEARLELFGAVLTPEQLQKYKQGELADLEMVKGAMSLFLPGTTNAPAQ